MNAIVSFLLSLFARLFGRTPAVLPSAPPPPPLDTPPAPSLDVWPSDAPTLPPASHELIDVPAPAAPATTRPSTPSALAVAVEDRRFRAHLQGGARAVTRVIVIHCTEGATAAGAATWFADKRSTGSTHVVVDDGACFRTVEDDRIAYGAHPFNRDAMHIEIAGFARWTRDEWLQRDARIRRAARVIASWVRKYEIQTRLLVRDDLLRGPGDAVRGITTHAAIDAACGNKPGTQVCGGAGDHWDPGPGFPIDLLLQYVGEMLDEERGIA
jgi:hypothetical protein